IDSLAVSQGTGDFWDSGEISSEENLVVYKGKELLPFTRYFWRIYGKDMNGTDMESTIAVFETGMLDKSNWKGAWISDRNSIEHRPAPYFRKEFTSTKRIKSARVYIAAAGLYELSVNGQT